MNSLQDSILCFGSIQVFGATGEAKWSQKVPMDLGLEECKKAIFGGIFAGKAREVHVVSGEKIFFRIKLPGGTPSAVILCRTPDRICVAVREFWGRQGSSSEFEYSQYIFPS